MRKRALPAAFGPLLVSIAFPAERLILTVSAPEVAAIDTARWQSTHRTPLPGVPAGVTILPDPNLLYILVNGGTGADGSLPKGPSEVVIYDRSAHCIVQRICLGWGVTRMMLTADERFVACFREQSPRRDFERAPSLAVGLISLAKQAAVSGRPSSISLIDTETHKLRWQKEMGHDDRNVLFSRVAGRFCIPDSYGGMKLIDLEGNSMTINLPGSLGKRRGILSPSGRWLYMIESGKFPEVQKPAVNGRIFAIDLEAAALKGAIEVDHEELSAHDSSNTDGIVIASESGWLHNLTGPVVTWRMDRLRHFPFTRWMDAENGLLIGDQKQLMFVPGDQIAPSWKLDWHEHLKGDPGDDIVRVPSSPAIAFPLVKFNQGPDLDQVLLVDLQQRRVVGAVPVGRRGRMAAKSVGLAAAETFSSPSTWSRMIPGPQSFNWNGFAIDLTNALAKRFRALVAQNPLLVAGPDGQFLYAMSRYGNDVTIIRTSDAGVVTKMAVGSNSRALLTGQTGNLLCAWTGSKLTWIDMTSNSVASIGKPCHGSFVRAQVEPEQNLVVTFSDRCANFWDGATGHRLAAIENLGKPRLLLQ